MALSLNSNIPQDVNKFSSNYMKG